MTYTIILLYLIACFVQYGEASTKIPDKIVENLEFITKVDQNVFRHKCKNFYAALKLHSKITLDRNKNCYIQVTRSNVAIDSFNFIMKNKSRCLKNLKRPLRVQFDDENGVDHGGPSREWFSLVSKAMVHEDLELFQFCDNYRVEIYRNEKGASTKIKYLEAAGILTAMAIFHQRLLGVSYSKPFLKSILQKPITLEDLKTTDEQFYNSLIRVQENGPSNLNLEQRKNPRTIVSMIKRKPPNEESKEQFIKRVIFEKYVKAVEKPMSEFLTGFKKMIPLKLLKDFDEDELDLLISGKPTIDVTDWENNTTYLSCQVDSELIKWFWEIVKKFNPELQTKLLKFTTGSSRVPPNGFEGFTDSQPPFKIICTNDGRTAYPTSNTCSRWLKLPKYDTLEQLEDKLKSAIEQPLEFYDQRNML